MAPFSWIRWLLSFGRSRVKTHRRHPSRQHLRLEELETRLAPASHTWTGAAAATNANWTNGANWTGGAPVAGDDLVFPTLPGTAPAAALTPTNDFASNTVFKSITISGSAYRFGGNPLLLGTASGTSLIVGAGATNNQFLLGFDVTLGGAASDKQTIDVGNGGVLTILSHLGGNSTMAKDNVGTLILSSDNSATLHGA